MIGSSGPEASTELGRLRERVAELERSLAETQELVRAAPAFFGFLFLDGGLADANLLALEVIEASREEVLGLPFWECPWWKPVPESARRVQQAVLAAARGETFQGDLPYWSIRAGVGSKRWVALTVGPRSDGARLVVTGVDITERRRTEDQLRAITDLAPQLVWMSDARGVLIYANQQLIDHVGGPLDGELWSEHVHPDDRAAVRTALSTSLASGTPWRVELRLRSQAGDYVWFLGRAVPIRERPEGPIDRWLGVLVDIGEQKRTAHETSRMSELLDAIMESSRDLIYVKDRQGRMVYCNPITLRRLNATAEQIYGKNDVEFLGPGKGGEQILRTDEEIMATGLGRTEEEHVSFADGTISLYLSSKQPHRDEQGTVIGIIGISRDITEFKRAQQQVVDILESTSDAFFALDKDFNIVRVNAQHVRITRLSREAQLGQSFLRLFLSMPGAEHSTYWRELHRAMTERVAVSFEAFQEPLQIWTLTSIYPQADGGLAVFFRDVTAQKKNEERLRAAIAARDAFLRAASHELRSPLNSLLMQAQLNHRQFERAGAQAFDAEKLRKQIASSLSQTSRLSQLVDELLDVTRIASGQLAMNFERIDLSRLVGEAVQRFVPHLQAVGCGLTLGLEPNVTISADAYRVEQVVSNLMSNVVKYAPGAPVAISLRSSASGATVIVKDQGKGIPSDKFETIFERFARLEAPRSVSGLGLGLTIAKEIVEAHGGAISVASPPGAGAEFTVSLPSVPSPPRAAKVR